jgi:hypothetical protein
MRRFVMSSEKVLEDDNFSDDNIPDWVIRTGIVVFILCVVLFGLVPWTIGIGKMIMWII